jgi:putative heme-binding domain-containing protein
MTRIPLSRAVSAVASLLLVGGLFWIRVGAEQQPTSRVAGPPAAAQQPRFTAAEGFSVDEVYPADKSGTIVNLTFDADGHFVGSRERGPIVRLFDRNGDGRFDEEQVVTDKVTNCQGLLFDGPDLYAVGLGPDGTGLYRVRDTNADGVGDGVELVTQSTADMQEHGPHAVFFGPDGYIYWILGNHTGIVPSFSPASPHRGWREGQLLPAYTDARGHAASIRAPGSFITRRDMSKPDADWEMVAAGFRNAYDAGFNLAGELFTFDSDMEWDIDLPWYRPVRTNHVVPGGEYGWRTGSGKWPDYYPDSLPGLTDVGRGSPVGVVFYQADAYPERYRDAFLIADWSRGRILAGFMKPQGGTYTEEQVDFVLGTPMNVTDLDVGADGNVYFSKGGRNTEGGLYRVVHRDARRGAAAAQGTPVERALAQPQPRSSWGRAAIAKARGEAGATWASALTAVATGSSASPDRRVRAIELLQVTGAPLDVAALTTLSRDTAADVRAAATYYLGLHATDAARTAIAARFKDDSAFVRRRAAEAMVRTGIEPSTAVPFDPAADLLPLLGDADRFVRYSAREALERTNRNRWRAAAMQVSSFPAVIDTQLALVETQTNFTEIRPLLTRQLAILEAGVPDQHLPAFLRVVHLTMQRDDRVDYSALYSKMTALLLAKYPTASSASNREIAMTLAYVGTAEAIPAIVGHMTTASTSRLDQLHDMYVLRTISRGWEPSERKAVVQWFTKVQDERWKGGASFIGFVQNMWNDFSKVLTPEELAGANEVLTSLQPQFSSTGTLVRPGNDVAAFSEQELTEYLLWDPMAYTGDAKRGMASYEKGSCVACHRFGDIGQSAGPDLTDVARRFKRADLLEAILHPSKTISDQWASVEIATTDKKTISGVITTETADSITVAPLAGAPVTIAKSQVASRTASSVSPMPEGLLNAMSLREISDLFAFLENPPAR